MLQKFMIDVATGCNVNQSRSGNKLDFVTNGRILLTITFSGDLAVDLHRCLCNLHNIVVQ
jgi:hypothetical protein